MLRFWTFPALLLSVSAAACGGRQSHVPLVGTASDIQALVGEWVGDYSSAESGRSGSISFTLRAGGDSAFGDVVMIPTGWGRALKPWQGPNAASGTAANPPATVLTIRFVRVLSGRVTGTLDPYADPVTGDRLLTRFTGHLQGNTITGTYSTRLESGQTQTGRWTVQRR